MSALENPQNAANAIAVLPFVIAAATLSLVVRNYGLCRRKAALNVGVCSRAFQLTSWTSYQRSRMLLHVLCPEQSLGITSPLPCSLASALAAHLQAGRVQNPLSHTNGIAWNCTIAQYLRELSFSCTIRLVLHATIFPVLTKSLWTPWEGTHTIFPGKPNSMEQSKALKYSHHPCRVPQGCALPRHLCLWQPGFSATAASVPPWCGTTGLPAKWNHSCVQLQVTQTAVQLASHTYAHILSVGVHTHSLYHPHTHTQTC